MERSLIIIKPDAVQRGLIGEIIKRFEQRGLRISGMKFTQISEELARKHYAEHDGKPFFAGLVQYITSAPVVLLVLEGPNVISATRTSIGSTKPWEAPAGTIRGDFGMDVGRNLVHGSDSPESGEREVKNFFSEDELTAWDRSVDGWIYE